jgi:hypothetical protein
VPVWICAACGNHYPEAASPPAVCVICSDERQWVPPTGQRWTTMAELRAAGHRAEVRELEPRLLGIGVEPPFAIGQRALLVRTAEGNLLWDLPGFVDERAFQAVRDAGGLRAVSASHPHFYGAIVEWSHAFDAEILLPGADAAWLTRPDLGSALVVALDHQHAVADHQHAAQGGVGQARVVDPRQHLGVQALVLGRGSPPAAGRPGADRPPARSGAGGAVRSPQDTVSTHTTRASMTRRWSTRRLAGLAGAWTVVTFPSLRPPVLSAPGGSASTP